MIATDVVIVLLLLLLLSLPLLLYCCCFCLHMLFGFADTKSAAVAFLLLIGAIYTPVPCAFLCLLQQLPMRRDKLPTARRLFRLCVRPLRGTALCFSPPSSAPAGRIGCCPISPLDSQMTGFQNLWGDMSWRRKNMETVKVTWRPSPLSCQEKALERIFQYFPRMSLLCGVDTFVLTHILYNIYLK